MSSISAVVITKNEAENIKPCLLALMQVTDDIVVVDANSSDNTKAIAKELGAQVYTYEWQGYSKNKNYGNSRCQHDWVLSIDADEILSDELIATINQLEPQEGHVYSLDRITNYCGEWIKHSGWYPDWKIRLFNRQEIEWKGDFVHERLALSKQYKNIELQGKVYHYSYKSSDDHLERIERYAHLAAQELKSKNKNANFIKLYISPIFRFFRTYILKKGILDGKNGLIISRRNAYLVHRKYRILKGLK